MFAQLMTTRRFAPLFWCQFFSAFNDNFLKNSLVFLILFKLADDKASGQLITLAAAVLIFPFFILSAIGGEVADRFDKALVAKRLKFVEIAAAAVAVAGFALHSIPILFFALFLFGVIAALFGPIKYGILPDHLAEPELPSGNALVEGATFIAILTGTIVGGQVAKDGGHPAVFGTLMMVFAVLCWLSARAIPRTGEAAPNLKIDFNIARSTWRLLGELKAHPRLWWGAMVVSWFWVVGAVALSLLPTLVRDALGGNADVINTYIAVFSIAIAIGSGLAAWLVHGRINLLVTTIGAFLLAIFALDVGLATSGVRAAAPGALGLSEVFGSPRGIRLALDLAGMAIAGGLFIVPAFSAFQTWAEASQRARMVAANNVLNAAFIVTGTIVVVLIQAFLNSAELFYVIAGCCFLAAIVIARTAPTSALRDFLSLIGRVFFRVEIRGFENVAKAGRNPVIALNHTSFLDAALALSFLDNEPVFAIDSDMSKKWWVKPFMRITHAMPIDPTKPLATRTLINVVREGKPLIIFPEGRLTVTGSLMKIYDGAGLIADKTGALVLPIRIRGLEKTPFTRLSKEQVPRSLFPKVTVDIVEPVTLDIDPALRGKKRRMAAGAALYNVMSDLLFRTTSTDRTLFQAVLAAAHEHGHGRIAVEDPVSGTLTYKRLLLGANILGRKLMPLAKPGAPLAVMLPNANGAAVTILGLMSAGRVPAMLNFTAGLLNLRAACAAAQIDTVVTSRAFVEKGRLDKLIDGLSQTVRIVYLEDVRSTIGGVDKVRGLLGWKKPLAKRKADDWAVVLFTSGSEGTPKGVVLSHRNMLTNVAQAQARIDFGRTDKVFNVLPVFHSFGLTIGMMLPLACGVRLYLYPSPLHYRIVPELVYGTNSTILFGTDTFLAGYARSANAYDFRSLRLVLAGAEAVKDATRKVYLEKFGLRILEGYGVTETAPALAFNTAMFNRFGTVGRLMPGMEARLEPVPGVDEGGRMFVRGPNVMLGYLRAENPGVLEPPAGGWHDTGDIVAIDPEGFVAIKGRAKRFAKIGGEMISLAAVEMLVSELWPDDLSGAVTAPDLRKGERVVLVTTKPNPVRGDILAFARQKGASEMMVPSEVMIVDKLPVLGSGKVDHIALSQMVRERLKLEGAA